MGLFDLVFDELGKEIKEAPGWLSLVFLCNLLLFVPGINEELKHLHMSKQDTTVATLVAMTLFFLGDMLDSFVFPREGDGKRSEKLLKTSMLLVGAFAVFFFLLGRWWWAVGLAIVWILIIAIYDTRKMPVWLVLNRWIRTAAQSKAGAPKECDEVTGFKWVVLQYEDLTESRNKARDKLCIPRGMYNVSKVLAQKAKRYTIPIWLPNEAAKFIRSAVLPTFGASLWLLLMGDRWIAALLALASPALLLFYCWLKGLHMRKLYDLAIEIVDQKGAYGSPEPCHGVRLFLWEGSAVACVGVSESGSAKL